MIRTLEPRVAASLVLLVSAVVAGCLPAIWTPAGPDALLIGGGALVVILPFAVVLTGRRFDPFEPVYLFAVSYGILFVLRPVVELAAYGSPQPFGGQDPTPTYNAGLLLALCGAASFMLAYYSPVGRRIGARFSAPTDAYADANLAVGTLFVVLLSSLAFGTFLASNGGLDALATLLIGRNEGASALLSEPAGYLFAGPLFLTGVALLLLALTPVWRSPRGAVAFLLLGLANMTSLGQGGRIWLLPSAMAVILIWYLRRDRRPSIRTLLLAAFLVFFVGVTVPRDYRNVGTRVGSPIDALANALLNPAEAARGFLLGADTAMASTLAMEVAYVPAVVPFQLGSTYVEALARPIPRGLWRDKPYEIDVILMGIIWPQQYQAHVQYTFSIFGEPYVNWGLVGVIGFCLAFGVAWRAIFEWVMRNKANRFATLVYATSLPFLIVYVRGGVGVDYQRQLIYLIPAIGVAWYARRRGTRIGAPAIAGVAPAVNRVGRA